MYIGSTTSDVLLYRPSVWQLRAPVRSTLVIDSSPPHNAVLLAHCSRSKVCTSWYHATTIRCTNDSRWSIEVLAQPSRWHHLPVWITNFRYDSSIIHSKPQYTMSNPYSLYLSSNRSTLNATVYARFKVNRVQVLDLLMPPLANICHNTQVYHELQSSKHRPN